jgi:hypothetical protein
MIEPVSRSINVNRPVICVAFPQYLKPGNADSSTDFADE